VRKIMSRTMTDVTMPAYGPNTSLTAVAVVTGTSVIEASSVFASRKRC